MANTNHVSKKDVYITAAFRSARMNEAYLFMKRENVLYEYGQQPKKLGDDKILRAPDLTITHYPFLENTVFEDLGVQCAFASHTPSRAFIFAANQVAEIDYAPYGGAGKLIRGPIPVDTMFPVLKGTVFRHGVQAAFDSSVKNEAYLFRGDQVACLNYSAGVVKLNSLGSIKEHWPAFKGTIFENGIDAAYTLWEGVNEAFIFKGDSYARIEFTPGETKHRIAFGPDKIKNRRPALSAILPRNK